MLAVNMIKLFSLVLRFNHTKIVEQLNNHETSTLNTAQGSILSSSEASSNSKTYTNIHWMHSPKTVPL